MSILVFPAPAAGSGGIDASTFLDVSMGGSVGNATTQTIANAFTTVAFSTVNAGAANWNATTRVYTVPSTGLYMAIGKLRPTDGTTSGFGIGVGIHTSNSDGPHFVWHVRPGSAGFRHTLDYQRMARFTAGDQLRMFAYVDNSTTGTTFATASMTIVKLAD